eukprot:TRINITY_DN4230_c0_g1_i1.p1 TRINITY_DN4230_c0_g1~~TRINITY_DN4230_c0_g1_i1.p1  ORF type:complete len:297 (+),score=41.59 TRINITY_DN4230_c0_g1_i1:216-1106(+)
MGDSCSAERGGDSEAAPAPMPGGGRKLGDMLADGEKIPTEPEAWKQRKAPTTNVSAVQTAGRTGTITEIKSSDQPVSCESKLRLCPEDTLTILRQILDNIRANPWDSKFRVLHGYIPKIRTVLSSPGCAQLLIQLAGFVRRQRTDVQQGEFTTLQLSEALKMPESARPDWDKEEDAPYSQRDILVLPEGYKTDNVERARVTVDSCLNEKAAQFKKPAQHKQVANGARAREGSEERQARERILAQHREQQQTLRERQARQAGGSSHANVLQSGAKYNTCNDLGITHRGGSVEPRPGG